MMKRVMIIVLLGFIPEMLVAQEKTPRVLRKAAHCLVTEKNDWLGLASSKEKTLKLGYFLDRTTVAGQTSILLIAYSGERKGLLFMIVEGRHKGKPLFTISNNAAFVDTPNGPEFTEDPLGGVWTVKYLKSAITKINARAKHALSVASLRKPTPVLCDSYASPRLEERPTKL